jgi:pseudouridine kinase
MEVMKHLTPEYIDKHNAAFDNARLVMIDANLPDKSIETVVWLCRDRGIPLAADPTSVPLAARLRPYLKSFYLVSPNAAETAALCEKTFDPSDPDAAGKAAWQLVQKGVEVAVVTLSEFGVVYRSGETKGHIPALKTNVVDQTGAGDAQTAAILFGLLEGIPLDEAVRLGVTAASLTLRSRETVRHDLSVELLYDELVI